MGKHKRKRDRTEEETVSEAKIAKTVGQEHVIANLDEPTSIRKHKKHKKKNKSVVDDSLEASNEIDGGKEEKQTNISETVLDNTHDTEHQHARKKKKKKSKHKNKDIEQLEGSSEIVTEASHKQEITVGAEESNANTSFNESDSGHVAKKKKKKKEKVETEKAEVAIQDRNKTSAGVTVDRVVKSAESGSVKTGQWSSAQFDNSEKQNKFFRLLGGLKNKESSNLIKNKFQLGGGSAGSTEPFRTGGNRAMNKEEQAKYANTMEKDFERALSSNINRGIGLGFAKPPEEGKKFYIDTSKSKSIKFDD